MGNRFSINKENQNEFKDLCQCLIDLDNARFIHEQRYHTLEKSVSMACINDAKRMELCMSYIEPYISYDPTSITPNIYTMETVAVFENAIDDATEGLPWVNPE